jgi:ribosomal-protein-serine acetyltransferase
MFVCQFSESIKYTILETRHAGEFFRPVRQNYDRLLVWCPWLGRVRSIESTRLFLREKLQRFTDSNGFTAGVFDGGNLVDVIAFEYIDEPNSITEIGYWLDSYAEVKGLVIRSCRAVIDHALHELKLGRIQIRCATENRLGRTVAGKLGFPQEGIIRLFERLYDRTVNLVVYGMLSDEWGGEPMTGRR